jgi:hypothetical protein
LSTNRFNEILFAASLWPTYPYEKHSLTTLPHTDEKIVWADITTEHSGFIHRIDKFPAIVEFIKDHKIILKVCPKPYLNCCQCEKCYSTIMTLILHGIDPNDCGFSVSEETFKDMRRFFEKVPLRETMITSSYSPIKKMIPDNIENDFHESKEFFHWIHDFDLYSNINDNWGYRVIYNKLPFSLANIFDKLLRKRSINVQPAIFDKRGQAARAQVAWIGKRESDVVEQVYLYSPSEAAGTGTSQEPESDPETQPSPEPEDTRANQHGIMMISSDGNSVSSNIVLKNYGFDLYWDEYGAGNSWSNNKYNTQNWP